MTVKRNRDQLLTDLAAGQIVPLTVADWTTVADAFKVVSETPTGLGGSMLLVRRPLPGGGKPAWALVEDPQPGEKVVRPLRTKKEALALIAERQAAYERMWDG